MGSKFNGSDKQLSLTILTLGAGKGVHSMSEGKTPPLLHGPYIPSSPSTTPPHSVGYTATATTVSGRQGGLGKL